jgi:hypothetical protein
MKYIILITCALYQFWGAGQTDQKVFKYNSCDFSKHTKNISQLSDANILAFKIANDENKRKDFVSAYYLIKSSGDTFNVIQIFNMRSSDRTVRENKDVTTWNFEQMKDTCINFKSYVDLKKTINYRYPVLLGDIYLNVY